MPKKIIENAQPLPKWADEYARSSHYENISKGLAEKPWLLSEDEVRTLMAPGLPYQINSNETMERHRQEPDIPMKELIAVEMYNRAFEHLYIKNSQYHDWLTGDKQQYPSLATYEFLDGIKHGLERLPDTPEKRRAQELCEGKLNALESEANIERSAWNKQKEMEKQARQKEEAYKKREAAAFEKYLEKTTKDIKRAGWYLTEEQIRGFVGAARYLKWDNGEFAKDKIDTPETREYLQFIEDLRYGRTPQTPKLTLEDDPGYKQYITLAMIEHGHSLRASMGPSIDGRLYYADPYQQEAHRQYVAVHNKLFQDAERQEDKFKEFGTTAEIAERKRRDAEDEARRQKQREEIAEKISKEAEEWRNKQNQGPTLTPQEKQKAKEAAYAHAVEEFARKDKERSKEQLETAKKILAEQEEQRRKEEEAKRAREENPYSTPRYLEAANAPAVDLVANLYNDAYLTGEFDILDILEKMENDPAAHHAEFTKVVADTPKFREYMSQIHDILLAKEVPQGDMDNEMVEMILEFNKVIPSPDLIEKFGDKLVFKERPPVEQYEDEWDDELLYEDNPPKKASEKEPNKEEPKQNQAAEEEKRKAEEAKRIEEENKRKAEEEEKQRKAEEEAKRKAEEEEKKRKEEEAKRKAEEEEKKRKEEEAKRKAEEEEKKRKAEEAKKRELEEQKKRELEEQKKRELEEQKKREREEQKKRELEEARRQEAAKKEKFVNDVAAKGWKLSKEDIGMIYDLDKNLPANDPKNTKAWQNLIRKEIDRLTKGKIEMPHEHYDITQEPQHSAMITQRLLINIRLYTKGAMDDPKSGIQKNPQFLSMLDKNLDSLTPAVNEERLNDQAAFKAKTAAKEEDNFQKEIKKYREKDIAVQPVNQRSERERDSLSNQKLLNKIMEQVGNLHAKHRTGFGGSSTEHDRLKRQVDNLETVLNPHEINYTTERKAQVLKDAKKAAEDYIIAKNHQHGIQSDDPNEVAVLGTKMGEKRYNAARAILEICKKELQRMKAMGLVDAVDNKDIPQANAEQIQPLNPENDLRYSQDMLKGLSEKKELDKNAKLTDTEFSCLAHILAFNMAYPDPQNNKPDDKLSFEQKGQQIEITRAEYHKALPTQLLADPTFQRMRINCKTDNNYKDLVKKATEGNGKQLIDEYAKIKQAMKNEQNIQNNNKLDQKKDKKLNMQAGKN